MEKRETKETLDVAVLQLTSVDDVPKNVAAVLGLLKECEAVPPDLVSMPENSFFLSDSRGIKSSGRDVRGSRAGL